MKRIIYGDNQFFGINHMSEEKARAQSIQFRESSAIVQLLAGVNESGVNAFMCTTHERMADVCRLVRADPMRFEGMEFYPSLPYAHKYANAATERGILGALREFLPEGGALGAIMKSGRAVAAKDVESLIEMLVDVELASFSGIPTPVIFLQNVVTDLLLGMGFLSAFRVFDRYVRERYGAEPGYITMNLPLLVEKLASIGIENPIVCANINKIGFRMSGGIDRYIAVLREGRCRAVAMSVFASGAIPPAEAIEWVCELDGVESIVFGASSTGNVVRTRALVEHFWGTGDRLPAGANL